LKPEERGDMALRISGNLLQDYTVLQPRKTQSKFHRYENLKTQVINKLNISWAYINSKIILYGDWLAAALMNY
jgi:hypothetical protein